MTGVSKSGPSCETAQLSLPPLPLPLSGSEGLCDFSPFPPPLGEEEGQSEPEMETGILVVVDGGLTAIVGVRQYLLG